MPADHFISVLKLVMLRVRAATDGAAAPQFTVAPVGSELRLFMPVTQSDKVEMVRALLGKQCIRSAADMAA